MNEEDQLLNSQTFRDNEKSSHYNTHMQMFDMDYNKGKSKQSS